MSRTNFRQRSVDTHQFAMIPRADIPRSTFMVESAHKTTFDAGPLVPIYCEEVLPGDTFNVQMTAFARMATPIYPVMDNLHLESFFFFVPCRLVWANWRKFQGEQDSPGDSISFTIPQVTSPVGGNAVGSLQDYFGLPTIGQMGGGNTTTYSALPLRAYNLIFNQWFRDENLVLPATVLTTDGPETNNNFSLRRRGKRHDYFTSCLPFVQKGTSVPLPLGTSATVRTNPTALITSGTVSPSLYGVVSNMATLPNIGSAGFSAADGSLKGGNTATPSGPIAIAPSNLYADLSTATAATINQIRQAFQIQKVLERDARGGTRYTEIVRAHFGVVSPDARLQRPEYLGGGYSPVNITPVAQTAQDATEPLATLSAFGTSVGMGHRFSQSFTEHGYIIGLINVRADLTYQQGVRRLWSRLTRYDFYMPAFAHLGEQAVLNKEIYCDGSATDANVFGFQERWAEYRYQPSMITGLFRSTSAGTLDGWHLAQDFASVPTLNSTFITETPPLNRVLAVGAGANGAQFLADLFFKSRVTRPLPVYSVPGLVDHF